MCLRLCLCPELRTKRGLHQWDTEARGRGQGPLDSYLQGTLHSYSYIDLGRLAEGSHRVHMVVEDDDPYHHPHAEHERLFTREPAPVLPEREKTVATAPLQHSPGLGLCSLKGRTLHPL